jgi:hypothetical protein
MVYSATWAGNSFQVPEKLMKNPQTLHFPFDAEKVTEVAAQFLIHAQKYINIMRLVKLVYLLDRKSIARRGVPVVGGVYLSMPNGPVTSEVLDLINSGSLPHYHTDWERFISDRQDHEIALTEAPGREHLSDYEIDLIREVYLEHQKEDQFALRDWCHANCGEWTPLDKGCADISLERLASEVGRDPDEVIDNALEQSFLDEIFQRR